MGAHIRKDSRTAYCGKILGYVDSCVELQTYQNQKIGAQRICTACKAAADGRKLKKSKR